MIPASSESPRATAIPIGRVVMMMVLFAGLGQLAGCASGPQSGEAVKWVSENEAQRQRLEADGFPQYIGGN